MAIGGIGGLGNLMGIVGWMQQMTPGNVYGNMNPQLVGAPNPNEASLGNVPGVDFESLRGTMMRLQEIQQARDTSDKTFAERREKDLDEAKQAFWDNHHYEWPDGPGSQPVVADGPENVEQARARQRYERQQLEAYQDAKAAQGNVPAGPNTAQLQHWQKNPEELRAFMQSPEGQAQYKAIAEAAQIEEEVKGITDRANELKATMPPQLHAQVDATRDAVLQRRADSHAALQATPEARVVDDYQRQIQQWIANQQGALQAEKEQNWQPYKPQVMPDQVDPQGVTLPPFAFQNLAEGNVAGPTGGEMPLMNPAIYNGQGGGPLINPALFQRPV